jgi:hypothetical protein
VIVTPHWGHEDSHQPLASDRTWARQIIEAGAAAVVGAHPHVLQPWEKVTTPEGHEGLVIYSLGNFISNQRTLAQRTGVIALIELARRSSKASVSAAGFVPTWVDVWRGHVVAELTAGSEGRTAALEAALRILPAGNRVGSATYRALPRACVGAPASDIATALIPPSVAATPAAPPDASLPVTRPAAVRGIAPAEPDMADETVRIPDVADPQSALPDARRHRDRG